MLKLPVNPSEAIAETAEARRVPSARPLTPVQERDSRRDGVPIGPPTATLGVGMDEAANLPGRRQEHSGPLCRMLRCLTADDQTAAELADWTFAAAGKDMAPVSYAAAAATEMRRIAYREYRRRLGANGAGGPAAWTITETDFADAGELRTVQFSRALAQLTPDERDAFLLTVVLELPVAEVAKIVEADRRAVKSRQRAAWTRLRTLLAGLPGNRHSARDVIVLGVICLRVQSAAAGSHVPRPAETTVAAGETKSVTRRALRRGVKAVGWAAGWTALSVGLWMAYLVTGHKQPIPPQILPQENAYDYYNRAGDALKDRDLIGWLWLSQTPPPKSHIAPPHLGEAITEAIRQHSSQEGKASAMSLGEAINQRLVALNGSELARHPNPGQRRALAEWSKKANVDLDVASQSRPVQEALLDTIMRDNRRVFDIVQQGLIREYAEPRSPSALTFDANYSRRGQFFASIRGLTSLLVLKARVQAEHGDWAGAASTGLDAVDMGEQIPRGSDLLGRSVGAGCEVRGRQPIWEAIDHLSAKQARAVAARLAKISAARVPRSATVREEKMRVLLSCYTGHASGHQSRWTTGIIRAVAPRFVGNYIRYMDKLAETADRRDLDGDDPEVPDDLPTHIIGTTAADWRTRDIAGGETQNSLLRTALRLRAYRLQHGAYPADIDALGVLPPDPCGTSSSPYLHYTTNRSRSIYRLYSVGPDGRDDGGQSITKNGIHEGATARNPYGNGDIVAGTDRSLPILNGY